MRKRRLDDDALVPEAPGKERKSFVGMLASNEEKRTVVDTYDDFF